MLLMILLLCAGCAANGGAGADKGGFQIVDACEGVCQSDQMVTIFVGAHESVMSGLGEVKASNRQVLSDLGEIKNTNRQNSNELGDIKTTSRQALETAQRSLQMIEEMSQRHGTGEITIFFPANSASIDKDSLEFERLVHFADYLSRESRGRKLIFLSIGSASATGNKKHNLKLAKKRASTPLDVLDKYLVNVPHSFHKVYGTGDMYSPKNVRLKEHQRFQHARIIALFDTSQAPPVNQEAALK